EGLADAQGTPGNGALRAIRGFVGINDADVYKITICDPSSFFASTVNDETGIDTKLFLFDSTGHGVTVCDDVANGAPRSYISNQFVTTAGVYYIAVSIWPNNPRDSANALIFLDNEP